MSPQYVVRFVLPYSHILDVVCASQSEAEAWVRRFQVGELGDKGSIGGKDAMGRQWAVHAGDVMAAFSMPLQQQQAYPPAPEGPGTQVRSLGYPTFPGPGGMSGY